MWTYGTILILGASLLLVGYGWRRADRRWKVESATLSARYTRALADADYASRVVGDSESVVVELRDEVHRLKTQTAIKLQTEIARSRFSISEVVIAEAPHLASREWVRRVEQFDAELLRNGLLRMTDITVEQLRVDVFPWAVTVEIYCGVFPRWQIPLGGMIVLDGRIVQLGDPVDESTLPHHEIHMVRNLD